MGRTSKKVIGGNSKQTEGKVLNLNFIFHEGYLTAPH